MSRVIYADESASMKDFTQFDVPYGDWLLPKLKVRLDQVSKVWESFLRESCKVVQQAFGKPIEEISNLNWLFEFLIQTSGRGFESLWDDSDIYTDANGQVYIFALDLSAWQDATDLLTIEEDVVHPFHRRSLSATLLFGQVFDYLKSGDSGKLC